MKVVFAGSVHCAHNKRVEADAVKRRAVSCCLGGRAAHAQRYAAVDQTEGEHYES